MKTLIVLSLFALCTPALATPPNVLNFSGHLAGSAGALSGEASLTLALYDDPDSFAAAHLLWTEVSTIFVAEGRFHVLLGADPSNPLPATVLDASTVYVGVRVGADDELRPRLRVASVPFSLRAEEAERLGGLPPESFSPSGHTHAFDALQGQVASSQLPAVVVQDDELAAALATRSEVGHTHDAAYVNVGEANSVSGGMVQDGTLLLGDLGDSGCAGGQVAKWSASAGAWVCSDDATVEAGTGVVLEGGVLRLDQATVVGWATAACFDTPTELAEALDLRYAAYDHLHDDRYPLAGEVETALSGKADTGHLHDGRYPLAADVTTALAGKAALVHDHDARYYTRTESDGLLGAATTSLQTAINGKADASHLHDGRYPLATDVTAALAGKAALAHEHDAAYVNEGQANAITTAMLANGAVSLPKLADAGCADGQVAKWDDVNGRWSCGDDRQGQYSGADFALANQACPFGQLVGGVNSTGKVTCVDDVVYGAGTGLVLVGGSLNVDKGTIEGWARGTCYDTPAELATALDARYAALGHTHAAYATFADLNGALSTKADLFHDHADLYYLKDEADQRYVNEGQANAVTGAMIADGSLTLADLGPSTCAAGQIPKRVLGTDGLTYEWGCTADNDTQYTAGTALTLDGGRFDVTQATIEGWARVVAYDTPAELKAALPAWDQLASDDLTTATSFQGQVTGTYNALLLANDVVTTANLVNGTITAADLANGSVTSGAIANGGIGTIDLGDGSVTSAIIQNSTIAPADLADAAVTSGAIANGTIIAADLADGAVTSVAIANGTIATADLADAIIGSAQITNGSITSADLGTNSVLTSAILDGTISSADLGTNSVLTSAILDGTISSADLGSNSVTSAKILDATIVSADIANGAVTSAIIQNYTITSVDFFEGAVDTNALANDVVTANKLANDSVTTAAILDGTVTTADLANGAVTSAILATGAVAAIDLANDAVLTTHILNGTILSADLANQSVTSAIIANGAVGTVDLAPDAVTSAIIANGTISAVDMGANSVTTAAIANLAVGTLELAANAVTSEKIQNATIATADLAADAITSALILNGTIAGADLANGTLTNTQISASAAIDPAKILGTAWTSLNDVNGSGLNADLLDGSHAAAFASATHNHDAAYWAPDSTTLKLRPAAAGVEPVTCTSGRIGTIAMTSLGKPCYCDGTSWKRFADDTACAW